MAPLTLFVLGFLGAALWPGLSAAAEAADTQRPGTRHDVRVDQLPEPDASQSVANSPRVIARPAGAQPRAPAGFAVTLFADELPAPRNLLALPNGDVLVAQGRAGSITVLRDGDGDGISEHRATFATGFDVPFGLAFANDAIYVGDLRAVWKIPYRDGDQAARSRTQLTPDGALGGRSGHRTRNVAVSPDGSALFVAIGSRSNVDEEDAPRATIQRFALDGSQQETFARGLRNPVGIAFYPGTNDLYTVVNERDGLGDGLVPDYLTRVTRGQFYGWPYAYLGSHPDPDYGALRPDLVAKTAPPDVLFEAHSAPLGLVFYDRGQFPAAYRGDAFVALHGSWNRAAPTGYKVVRVKFEKGRPKGGYEDFLVGFWAAGKDTAEVWGRPAGLALAQDGSLLVADDAGQAVWRVAFTGN